MLCYLLDNNKFVKTQKTAASSLLFSLFSRSLFEIPFEIFISSPPASFPCYWRGKWEAMQRSHARFLLRCTKRVVVGTKIDSCISTNLFLRTPPWFACFWRISSGAGDSHCPWTTTDGAVVGLFKRNFKI